MNLQWPKYKETEVQRWNHSDVVLSNAKNTAFRIHTYNQSQHYEVIDLRYCEFLILPFFLGLFKRVLKRLHLYNR